MISHPLVDDYIKMAESGEIVVNKERKLLFKIIKEKSILVMIYILIMT